MIWAFGILGIYFFTSLYLQQTSVSRRPRPAWRSCRWRCASRCSRASPRGSRRGPERTARWRSGCCSWSSAWSCSPGSACTPATTACCPGSCCSARAPGLMNVPLTNAVMQAIPAARAGVASALLNASREVAGTARHHGDRRGAADPAGRRAAGRGRSRARVRGRLPPRPARHDRPARGRRRGQLRDPAPARAATTLPTTGPTAVYPPESAAVGELTTVDEPAGELMVADEMAH